MHILLTRPLDDSKELILKFTSMKHKVSHLPLLQIKKIETQEIDFSQFKGVIFTSANSLKNLNISKIDKKIICFCVGLATERKAKEVGFQNIFCAEGNVNNLKELILQNFDPKIGPMAYISGEIVSYNLDQDLISENYVIKRIINYTAIPNENLSDDFLKDIKSSQIGELILKSLRKENEVAYIRYASVYRKFNGVKDFISTLESLKGSSKNQLASIS